MLADSKLPTTLRAEAINLGKFDGKADEDTLLGTKACDDAGKARMEIVPDKDYILLPLWNADPPISQSSKSSPDAGFKPSGDDEKKVTKEPRKEGGDSNDIIFGSTKKSLCTEFEKMMHKKFQMSSMGELTFFLGLQTPMKTSKALLKDEDGEEVDVHLYRSMIGSLMYLTSSRPDIMFAVCACARYQVNPKISHLHAVKRIFSKPTDPQHHPQYSTIYISTLKNKRPRKPKRNDTEIPQACVQQQKFCRYAIYEERDVIERVGKGCHYLLMGLYVEKDRGGGPRRQETMRDTISQTRSENVSKHSNDPLLVRVLDLENTKTAQAQEITSLKLRVKKLEKKRGSRTHKLKRLYKVGRSARMVSSDDASLGDQEDASKQGRKIDDINKDAEITLIDETQGRYGDDLMFDTCILDDEEVFAR
ncbi:hypothetical protein Tco_0998904 [Tanacetum coccineum]